MSGMEVPYEEILLSNVEPIRCDRPIILSQDPPILYRLSLLQKAIFTQLQRVN